MNRKYFISLLSLIIISTTIKGQESYSTPNTGVNWSLDDLVANSEGVLSKPQFNYLLNGEIIISPEDTLSLDEIADIYCEPEGSIRIQGVFLSSNDESKSFIGNQSENPFDGFYFESEKKSIINNVAINKCKDISIISSQVSFTNCLFIQNGTDSDMGFINVFHSDLWMESCTIEMNIGAGVMSSATAQSSITITNSSIFANNYSGQFNVPQLNFGTTGINDTIKIINCSIEGGSAELSGGIAISTLAGGELNAVIKDNHIFENRYGIAVYGDNISAEIKNNEIIDNNIQELPMQGGSGITVYAGSTTEVHISENIIEGNLWGITLLNGPNVYMGDEEVHGNNTIQNNGNEGEVYNLYNNTPLDYSAKYNYWGSAELEEIENGIFHQNDNSSLGLISFEPYLNFPVSIDELPFTEKNLLFYPNPCHNFIYFKKSETVENIKIYSIDGKLNYSFPKGTSEISLSHLDQGIYILEAKINNSIKRVKLIKE